MIKDEMLKRFPLQFRYWETSWYKDLAQRYEKSEALNEILAPLMERIIYDPVTTLPTKGVLTHCLEKNERYLLAIIRIDNFSELGDLFGFDVSDHVLQHMAKTLMEYEKEFSYVSFHLGNNDFAILVPERDKEISRYEGAEYLRRIIKKIRSRPYMWGNFKIFFQIRVGASIIEDGNIQIGLSKANSALLAAIRSFQEFQLIFDEEQEKLISLDAVLRFSALVDNIENKKVEAFFQPIKDIETGQVVCYETLLRIENFHGRYDPAAPYLHLAKSTGYYEMFSSIMLEKVLEAIRKIPENISMNISFSDIYNPVFLEHVRVSNELVPDFHERVIFELIELEELIDDVHINPQGKEFFREVKTIGARFALDDFGSGFSNFAKLLQVPVDIIKLDGAIIKRLDQDEKARKVVRGIASYCRENNLKLIAESVENEQMLELLRSMNIRYAQGFHIGRPMSLDEIRKNY